MKQNKLDQSETVDEIERLIRAGRIVEAKQLLISINVRLLDRSYLSVFADLARRLRLHLWGIRLLRPIIRPETPVFPTASVSEKTVYAGLLIKIGANQEATQLLSDVAIQTNPTALLFQSQILFSQWDYVPAVRILEKALRSDILAPYQRAIFQVNLASAYLFTEKTKKCKLILNELILDCQKNNWQLLLGNSYEIWAQVFILEKNYSNALESIEKSQSLSGQHQRYSIFAEKWRLIAELEILNSDSSIAIKKIESLKSKAVAESAWEILRDLDFQIGVQQNHQNLLLNLYFGTPLKAYRRRIEKIFLKKKWKIPTLFTRKLSREPAIQVLNIQSLPLKKGHLLERLLTVLCLDYYRPMSLGELHSWLYPEDFFHPDQSQEKISDAVKKLRRWLKINNINLEIKRINSLYSIQASGPIAVQTSKTLPTPHQLIDNKYICKINTLKKYFGHRSFSSSQAAKCLNQSLSLTRLLLTKSARQNLVLVNGMGRARRYFF